MIFVLSRNVESDAPVSSLCLVNCWCILCSVLKDINSRRFIQLRKLMPRPKIVIVRY